MSALFSFHVHRMFGPRALRAGAKPAPVAPGLMRPARWRLAGSEAWLPALAGAIALLSSGLAAAATVDLQPIISDVNLVHRAISGCEIREDCAPPGADSTSVRKLLQFTLSTCNVGDMALELGQPTLAQPDKWEVSLCHGHWHRKNFAQYDLLDKGHNLVRQGHKQGFCVEDTQICGEAPAAKTFRCVFSDTTGQGPMGISVGWADVYYKTIECQFIDVTGLPTGAYILRAISDPDHSVGQTGANVFANDTTEFNLVISPNKAELPSTSQWGLILVALALLTVGAVYEFRRRSTLA